MVSRIAINFFKKAIGTDSILKTRTIQKLPETLIYSRQSHYKAFSTKNGNLLGEMIAYPITLEHTSLYYPNTKNKFKCLYIDELIANVKKHGIGKALIDVAKKESYKKGCDGRINLVASCIDESNISPQTFYYKMGFTTTNKKHLQEIIRLKDNPNPQMFSDPSTQTPMFFELNFK